VFCAQFERPAQSKGILARADSIKEIKILVLQYHGRRYGSPEDQLYKLVSPWVKKARRSWLRPEYCAGEISAVASSGPFTGRNFGIVTRPPVVRPDQAPLERRLVYRGKRRTREQLAIGRRLQGYGWRPSIAPPLQHSAEYLDRSSSQRC
jgi:hypothetical protein